MIIQIICLCFFAAAAYTAGYIAAMNKANGLLSQIAEITTEIRRQMEEHERQSKEKERL